MYLVPSNVFADAVRKFWEARERQSRSQLARGSADQGTRSAVTGGAQLNGFIRTIIVLLTNAGVRPEYIFTGRSALPPELSTNSLTSLPGFYRPTKAWDIVIVRNGELVAAIELKSQVGSFGNNFNNRTEEAIGTAADIWTAFRQGAYGGSPAPWLGYLFLLEDSPGSRRAIATRAPHLPVFPEFVNASYALRYELLCRRLVRERQYAAACFLTSSASRAGDAQNYTEPAEDLSAGRFLAQLLANAASHTS